MPLRPFERRLAQCNCLSNSPAWTYTCRMECAAGEDLRKERRLPTLRVAQKQDRDHWTVTHAIIVHEE